jgi:hypothetical protein
MKKNYSFKVLLCNKISTTKTLCTSVFFTIFFLNTNAQQWSILGNESQIASATSSYTTIALLNDTAFACFREGIATKVKRRNSLSGLWEQVGTDLGTNTIYGRVYFDKQNNLIAAYLDGANSNRLAVVTYNASTGIWESLGGNSNNLYVSTGSVNNGVSQYSSTPRFSLVFDSNNIPYIAFGDGTNLTPFVKKFDGTAWVTVGTGAVDAATKAVAVSLVIDESDVPWLAFVSLSTATSTSGTLALYKLNNTSWTPITTGVTTAIRHSNMVLNSSNNFTIAYFNTGNLNRATTITYNKTTNAWGSTSVLSSRDAPNLSLINDLSGNLYCSFIDYMSSTARFVAKVFKQAADSAAWVELKDPAYTTGGIDEPIGNISIATGSDTSNAYIIYTKTNSNSLNTPVVRKYLPPAPPATLSTNSVTNFTTTTAIAGGNITADGSSAITERGIVYGAAVNPTTANTKVVEGGTGIGNFSVTLTGLQPATFYNIRAYAISGTNTITYGNNVRVNTLITPDAVITGPKQMEYLNRGVIAVRSSATKVYIGWRLLGTDSANATFNIYRNGILLNSSPISTSTNYEDVTSTNGSYVVKAVVNGIEVDASSPTNVWANNQLSIPLQIPSGGTTPDGQTYDYHANDCSVGDVDGDGEYEIFVKWTPSVKTDNLDGYTGLHLIDCYKLNGTKLWQINLGKNIRAGDHYTQFLVYDFDGDGKAEMICKTADGTKDGRGVYIGDSVVDYRSMSGWVHNGPEFLTVFNGLTGAAMATVNYQPARGAVTDWGDGYGNRCDRFISAVAYLDGVHPSAIIGRGYYNKLVRAAYDWRGGQLTLRWIFNSKATGNDSYSSQGNHQMTIGDADGDGKDEIFNGSSAINDNGQRFWSSGNGHGDALHMTDMDPEIPGQEMWQCLESPTEYSPLGLRFNNAKTGVTLWGIPTSGDVGRAMAADIDSTHKGYEVWGSSGNLYTCKGVQISTNKPTYNFGIWWDGDLARELLDGHVIDKWNPTTQSLGRLFTIYNAAPVTYNNSTKKNPCLMADLIGDWREEVILRRSDNTALVLFTTTSPTNHRIHTLMHDPQYRTAIAWQNSGYNQPPYPSFYLGYNMVTPPKPNIYIPSVGLPMQLLSFNATPKNKKVVLNWQTTNEVNSKHFVVEHSINGRNFEPLTIVNSTGIAGFVNNYTATDHTPITGINYYRLKQVDIDGKLVYSEIKSIKFSHTKQLTVYPNPSSTQIKLEIDSDATDLKLSINTIDGKLIYQGKGSLALLNTDINKLFVQLTSGMYNVTLVEGNSTYNAKLVKQ